MNKCVFLDRDGVINRERGEYTYQVEDFEILPGVVEAVRKLKFSGYLVIVITNQAGISRGLYTRSQMQQCHNKMMEACDNRIDAIYYCPYHPTVSQSIARKPDTLMFEKAFTKYNINPDSSWMIGDKERDLFPAKKMGLSTVLIGSGDTTTADYTSDSLLGAVEHIIL